MQIRRRQSVVGAYILKFGLFIVVAVGVFVAYAQTQTVTSTSAPPPPTEFTAFERGEYYFNQLDAYPGVYDLAKARQNYVQAIATADRPNEQVWYQLGRVDFIEGEFDAAIGKFTTQIEYFGDAVPNVHYMLGLTYGYRALETNNPEDWRLAEQGFETFIDYAPTSPWPRVDLAWVYFSQGKFAEMLPLLEAGLEHEPEHAWLNNTYGLALLNTEQPEAARVAFLRAQAAAAELTVDDWGAAYSGNHPSARVTELADFRRTINENIALTD